MVVTLVGGTLAAGGANAINMVVDRDIDKLMPRTQGRPLVTGLHHAAQRARLRHSLLEVVAFGVLWAGANLLSAVLALSATLFYVFVYTLWLKRTSTPEHRHRRRRRRGARAGRLGRGHATTSAGRRWCCSS